MICQQAGKKNTFFLPKDKSFKGGIDKYKLI